MATFDVIVAGLGAAGSAALYHLAQAGLRVAGFDRHTPPHANGSSGGETRMIREAYYEDPRYVPFVRRAYELWHDLSRVSGKKLLVETGGVFAGPPAGELIAGMVRAGREHGIAIETLTGSERTRRAPWLRVPPAMTVIAEPRAGYLLPEDCIASHLRGASARGAEIHTEEPVLDWTAAGTHVRVRTPRGEYESARLVLCTGAWMVDALAAAGVTATVTRQPLFWFDTRLSGVPPCVWAVGYEEGRLLYGFPNRGTGLKVAIHYGGPETTPDTVDRTVTAKDADAVRQCVDQFLPSVAGPLKKGLVCMYTNSPDLHFVIDAHPAHENVLLVSACSGHGFKFASATGEVAALWARGQENAADMSLFSILRFTR